ncbi:fibronectin type III domain-containing protein [Flavobacterium sp. XN-5]|uniref:glycine-rich domain-containing protein n=1 Tax=Flavobacterium sp. XN-5 TaxID=2599390 RepID=UPI0011C7A169|nr:fibronectin type III domain-containing protein [Flavobacterium sp. XN-5]NGY38944.1 fibronectin type III domain-containing protein [Flavobacterium sp. XN-5]
MKKITFSEKTKITIATNRYVKILFVLFLLFGFTSVFGQSKTTFTTAGTTSFTAPPGITGITVEAWGGGAGGSSDATGRAGGGGAYASGFVSVNSGSAQTVTVGAGGSANGNGGNSIFGLSSVLAAGALGQAGGAINSSIGTIKFAGGDGGFANGSSGGGGGGSAFATANGNDGAIGSGSFGAAGGTGAGAGGRGGGNQVNGGNGVVPGGGGGGGGNKASGGNGASGQVIVAYYLLTSTSTASSVCLGNNLTITISGSAESLPVGDYTVTYDLSSPNASTNNSATMTVSASGIGRFGTVALNNVGETTITITSISSTIGGVVYKTTYDSTGNAKNKATITVNPASVGGTAIATTSTVCLGSGATINLTGSTGTIQWQQSSNGDTEWTAVAGGSGGTTTSYTTPNLSTTTYYRALVTSGVCAPAISTTAMVMMSNIPATPGAITGSATQCSGAITQIYSIAAVPNASSYAWTVPGGWSITKGQGTNAIEVSVGTGSGNISVNALNTCGTSSESVYKYITVGLVPTAPGSPRADSPTCTGFMVQWGWTSNAVKYYLDVSTNSGFSTFVSVYNNLDVGDVLKYGLTGLNPGTTYYYRVRADNSCGTSPSSETMTYATSPIPITAPVVTIADNIQCAYAMLYWNKVDNATGYYLDIAKDANFVNYVGVYQNFIVDGNNGNKGVSNLPSGDLYYRVRAYNSCAVTGNSNTGTFKTATPFGGTISPAQTICYGTSPTTNLTLNGIIPANAKVLNWQRASDAAFTTNVSNIAETTNILTVNKMGAITENTYFRAFINNPTPYCNSYSSPVLITVNNGGSGGVTPGTPGAIAGTINQCSGLANQVYSIVAVANATIYNWTVPTGWAITAGEGTTSISVTTGAAGQNGTITVSAGNGCGTSANTTLAVTVATCINKWKGNISTDWNNARNWTQNFVPAADASIVFDDAPVNHLVLDQNRSVTNITNAQSIYRVVCYGFKLTQKGNTLFTNGAQIDASTAGSVMEFAGAAAQSIPAGSFVNDAVFNLTVNNVNNVTVNGNLRILNLLNVSVGRLDAFSNSPTIIYGGSSAQTIESGQYLNEKMFNLNIDNATGVILNTNFTLANNLTIDSAKKFIVDAAKNLTVTGAIVNSAATSGLVLKSTAAGTASLIHNTDNVPATVQRYISGAKEAWHFLSSPVSNQTIVGSSLTPSGTYGNGTGYDLYLWNEPTPCWIYHKNDEGGLTVDPKNPKWPAVHSSTNFIPGHGYLYSVQATNPTTEFAGNLNNGNVNCPVTNKGPNQGDSVNDVRGFNLIGNPYPSSIDWLATSGWTRDALLVSGGGGFDMWIWNPVTSNYGVYNSLTAEGTNGVKQNIAPMQGFFVRAATNGNIGMTNSVRGTTGTSNWMRMKTTKAEIVKVQIESNDNYGSDEILLQFGAPANEAGAAKLFSTVTTAPSLFLNHEKKELSVLNLTDIIENSSVPLMFKAGKDGNYALSISNESASYDVLLLEDKKTKTITDLNANATYQFKGSVKDAADRFVLHFVPIIPEVVNLPATIYYDGNEINVDLTLVEGQTDIKVYDMLGRLLVDKKVEGKMIHSFAIKVKNEVYIVLANSKGKSISRKVLVY